MWSVLAIITYGPIVQSTAGQYLLDLGKLSVALTAVAAGAYGLWRWAKRAWVMSEHVARIPELEDTVADTREQIGRVQEDVGQIREVVERLDPPDNVQ